MSIVDGELTSLALSWRLERLDGAGIALTSHDDPVMSEGVRYEPAPGMTPAAVTRSLGLQPQSAEAAGSLSSAALEDADLSLGRWDGAQVRFSVVDWQNPDEASIQLLGGEIGSVNIDGDSFSAELLGAAAALEGPVCPATSAECRAAFGDKKCRIDLAGRTAVAHVTAADGGALTLDVAVDDRFVLGRLRYMSGDNCGIATVVLSASGNVIEVRELPRAAVESGCRVELREGCDKRFETCVSRFANAANFRGEPHLPGNDLLTRYPGA
ncbi:MAG TPA: DUF2163 domain-containing protein [Sphingomicrobium sp.]|nr:DUF2163 domain-containing protein [Sphingomicrobium sp.]